MHDVHYSIIYNDKNNHLNVQQLKNFVNFVMHWGGLVTEKARQQMNQNLYAAHKVVFKFV